MTPPRFRIRLDTVHIGKSVSRCYELYECDERGNSSRRVIMTPKIFGTGPAQTAHLSRSRSDIEKVLAALVRLGQ